MHENDENEFERKMDMKRAETFGRLNVSPSDLMDSTYFVYDAARDASHMHRTARGETRGNFVCACNDREIHCFDKRRLWISLSSMLSLLLVLTDSKFNL